MRSTRVLRICVCTLFALTITGSTQLTQQLMAATRQNAQTHHALYQNLPLAFECNDGQAPPEVDFIARQTNYIALFDKRGVTLGLKTRTPNPPARRSNASLNRLRIDFVGAAESRLEGTERLAGNVNYFSGKDPAKWHTNVPTFARVSEAGVYHGIDLVYYGSNGKLEYDLVARPGSDLHAIQFSTSGVENYEISPEGDLVMNAGVGELRLKRPIAYQQRGIDRELVPAHYVIGNTIAIEVGAYDHSRTLVIDPQLEYSTFLGSTFDDGTNDIAIDRWGNAYVTGFTDSPNFPNTTGGSAPSNSVAFVTKLDSTGSAVVYSTFLGGQVSEGQGIAVDNDGNAYATGEVFGVGFPVTASAFQSAPAGDFDAFLAKLDPSGSSLLYSSYLGGNADDLGNAVAVDNRGGAYVAGRSSLICPTACTTSTFPTTSGAFQTAFGPGPEHGFVARFDTTQSGNASLIYSTFLAGSFLDIATDVTVRDNRAYVVGETSSTDYPVTPGAFQTSCGMSKQGCADAFVTELKHDGSGLVFSTYLGGTSTDDGTSIALDAKGNVYVTGDTRSTDFPLKHPFQALNHGGVNGEDAFVTKLNPQGSALIYSTYLGGSQDDVAFGIAVDRFRNAHVTGLTSSTDFPLKSPIQSSNKGAIDVFVSKLNEAGNHLTFSTYLGGAQNDLGLRIRVDSRRAIYLTGWTSSTDLPVTPGAFQTTYGGDGRDGFVTKICVIDCP